MSIKKEDSTLDKNGEGDNNRENEKGKKISCNDLDDVLELLGSQGKYQKRYLYFIISPVMALEPLVGLNLIFMLYEPDHWCSVPGRDEAGVDLTAWKNLNIPREPDGTLSKCQMYGATNRSLVTTCTSGWDYDKTDYDHTIPSHFDWVCERGQWATWVFTANAVGSAIGTLALGHAADKIGRKPILVVALLLTICGRLLSLYVADKFWLFVALAGITGMGLPMIYIIPVMIGAELSSKEFRAWIYTWTSMTPVIGMTALPWIAYSARHWYTIGVATTIPCGLAYVLCVWVPESPRWLLSQGRTSKAAEVIKEIAKTNGTTEGKLLLSDTELDSMLEQIVSKQKQGHGERDQSNRSVLLLFSHRTLATNTILLTISWSMNVVIFYAITLNAPNLVGNQFLNFFLLALIELPACATGKVLCDKVGRRWTQVLFFLVCGVSSILAGVTAAGFTEDGGSWTIRISVIAAVVAKFAIYVTYVVVYLQAAEIFPTVLRSTGSGFASTSASIVAIFTPYMVYTGKIKAGAPWFIIGVMAVAGALASAALPETLNKRLPETLEDAANFGKGNKFWSLQPPKVEVEGGSHTT